MARKLAVVLFNLGGPDGPDDVKPFLFNLFNDKRIINVPGPIRWALAKFISSNRETSAQENYALMGGGSPLLAETQKQAAALEDKLTGLGDEVKCFIAMRYWSPYVEDAVASVRDWGADEIVLLPLYPQFSTTTTASSLDAWQKAGGPAARAICCYPTESGLVQAHADSIFQVWQDNGSPENVRVLFSAHGLPEKVVEGGDPYQWQVEQTCAAVFEKLPQQWEKQICYQSRVGPLKWIGPPTDQVIEQAAKDGKSIILSPIAFVSEHIETLVELDIEYAEIAKSENAAAYLRAPALSISDAFIEGLSQLVASALAADQSIISSSGGRICPKNWSQCPNMIV